MTALSINYLKENFWKVFTFRDYAYYLCKSDYGVIWGCEVGGDPTVRLVGVKARHSEPCLLAGSHSQIRAKLGFK